MVRVVWISQLQEQADMLGRIAVAVAELAELDRRG